MISCHPKSLFSANIYPSAPLALKGHLPAVEACLVSQVSILATSQQHQTPLLSQTQDKLLRLFRELRDQVPSPAPPPQQRQHQGHLRGGSRMSKTVATLAEALLHMALPSQPHCLVRAIIMLSLVPLVII